MPTAYENYGDESPAAMPVDRGFGAIPEPVPPKPAAPSRGDGFMWSGIILIIVAFIAATFPSIGLGPTLTWLGLFLAGTINLAASGVIRAIVDIRPK